MPTYRVIAHEIRIVYMFVEADSPEEARTKASKGLVTETVDGDYCGYLVGDHKDWEVEDWEVEEE